MIEQLSMDYIRTARAKGAPEHVVVLRHALKNAFLPVLSYLGPATAFASNLSFVNGPYTSDVSQNVHPICAARSRTRRF